jgi:hypothetical protein
MNHVLSKLNDYVLLIEEAQEKDIYAESRSKFKSHLAEASKMYAYLMKTNDINSIEKLVKSEIRVFGTSFLPGPYGEKITSYWADFVKETNIKN